MARGGMASIDLRGAEHLVRALDELTPKLEQRVLKKELRRAINLYRTAARRNAPRRTGALRKSIKTYAIRRRGGNRNQIGFRVSTGTRKQLGIAPDAKGYYPSAIEYGWADQYGNRHPPIPYARPAWNSTKPKIEAAVVDGIRSGLQRVARELGSKVSS